MEGTESFTVTLTGSSEVEVSNTAGNATVVILDDDGEFRLWQVQCCYTMHFGNRIVETHAFALILVWVRVHSRICVEISAEFSAVFCARA